MLSAYYGIGFQELGHTCIHRCSRSLKLSLLASPWRSTWMTCIFFWCGCWLLCTSCISDYDVGLKREGAPGLMHSPVYVICFFLWFFINTGGESRRATLSVEWFYFAGCRAVVEAVPSYSNQAFSSHRLMQVHEI